MPPTFKKNWGLLGEMKRRKELIFFSLPGKEGRGAIVKKKSSAPGAVGHGTT